MTLPSTSKNHSGGLEVIFVKFFSSGNCSSSKPTPCFFVLQIPAWQTELIGASLHRYLSYPFRSKDLMTPKTSAALSCGTTYF